MEGHTYSIIALIGARTEWEEMVETGLDWETARAKAVEWNAAERLANPKSTSWTRDLFYCQLEGTVRHRKLARQI